MRSTAPPSKLERQLRDMNEALVVSSVRQHELTEKAEKAEAALRIREAELKAELAASQQLQSVSSLLIEGGDSDGLYQKIVAAAAAIMHSDGASLQQLDENKKALRLLAWQGFGPEFGQTFALNQPDARTSCAVASRTGKRVIVPEVETCDFIVGTPALEDHLKVGIRAMQSTPLFSRGGERLGVISTHWRRPHTPTENDLRQFDILSRQAADLIERLQAEDRLHESEERYRSLTRAITSVVWTTDAAGRFVAPQPSWSAFTGQSWEELRDFGWANALHADDRERVLKLWNEARSQRTPYRSDGRMWHAASHSYHHFEAHGVPILNSDGSVREWVGKCLDVEDRKCAEAALECSELRYRRLFESAKDAILTLDAHSGAITDANPFMQRLLGYAHAEFIGRELWELGMFEDKEAIRSAFNQLQREGYVRFENLPLETKNGRKVEVEFISNVYEVSGQPVVQCNIRDITERIRLERKTQEQSEALADLHRRKDEFLAMLGHELRNPLAPISNALHLLRLQSSDEGPIQQQARTLIERQLTQLTRLVDDLLEVSRITTGRVHLRPERIVVSGIVERAVETAHPLLEQRMHELTVSVPPQPIWLLADAARLEQVFVNLLSNAAKFTEDHGRIWLTVEQEGDECVVRVRDSGVGIAPELLPRIFDLFTQAERSLDRSEGGLGIGLALVHRIVEMHKGSVAVQSTLGRGSEFAVRLPVAPIPKTPSQTIPTASGASTGAALRVLVVDDNVDSAESLGALLQTVGHHVHLVHDGPTAVQAAMTFRPNIALLDIGLPRMNGYEVAKKMRQEANLTNIVLVAMTGYGQESDRQNSLQAGFDYHLVKPANFGELQKILATVPEKSR